MTKTGLEEMRWSWLRDAVLPSFQVITESLWVYAVVVIVTVLAASPIRPSFLHVTGLLLVTAFTAKMIAFLPVRFPLNRILPVPMAFALVVYWLHSIIATSQPWSLNSSLMLMSAPSTLRPEIGGTSLFFVWILVLYLAGRGLLIGVQRPSTIAASRWFVAGAAVLVAVFSIMAWTSVPATKLPTTELRSMVFGYFVAGLAMVALTHWQSAHQGTGMRVRLSLSWAMAIALPVVLVVAASAVVVGGAGQAVQSAALSVLIFLYDGLIAVAELVWHAALRIWFWLVPLLRWLANLFPSDSAEQTTNAESWPHAEPPATREADQLVTVSVPQTDISAFVVAGLILLAVTLFVRALLGRRGTSDSSLVVEESLSMWSWSLLRRQVVDAWNALRMRWRARRTIVARRFARRHGEKTDETQVLTDMRRIYRMFLKWAAERDQHRASSATPLEFSRQLSRTIPLSAAQVDRITAYYVQARYGVEPISDDHLQSARRLAIGLPKEPRTRTSP